MGCRGIHFAITDDDVRALKAFETDDGRVTYVLETLEPRYFPETMRAAPRDAFGSIGSSIISLFSKKRREIAPANFETLFAESDKAWDAIHRCLSDGSLDWDGGAFPLNATILGGDRLHDDDSYLISLKSAEASKEIAEALNAITQEEFRRRYFSLDQNDYDGEIGEDDFDYTWTYFNEIRTFFDGASAAGRHVLFFADQ